MMTGEARVTDFNPRSPHGERLQVSEILFLIGGFQSTLPARGATKRFLLRQSRTKKEQQKGRERGIIKR